MYIRNNSYFVDCSFLSQEFIVIKNFVYKKIIFQDKPRSRRF